MHSIVRVLGTNWQASSIMGLDLRICTDCGYKINDFSLFYYLECLEIQRLTTSHDFDEVGGWYKVYYAMFEGDKKMEHKLQIRDLRCRKCGIAAIEYRMIKYRPPMVKLIFKTASLIPSHDMASCSRGLMRKVLL